MLKKEELAYFVAVHAATFLGARKMLSLVEKLGGARAVWEAEPGALLEAGLSDSRVAALVQARQSADPEADFEALSRKGMQVTTIRDAVYPEALRNIYDPPAVLYCLGTPESLNTQAMAVVGSRNCSAYGRKVAFSLGHDLARAGYWVVSGLARGIDTEVHLGVLAAGGRTVAVMGSGLEVVYPRENARLFARIAETGLVLSEFPPQTPPEPKNFPIRNRIISGLSRGVVVVEAAARSGALITADFALEQGRDVFAVPGPINVKTSQGTNNLIKQGAKLVTCVEDILEEYQLVLRSQEPERAGHSLGPDAERVLALLGSEPVHLDRLVAATHLSAGTLASLLLQMEFRGIIEELPGNYFVKLRDL